MMSSIKWDFILVRTEAGVLKIVRQEDIKVKNIYETTNFYEQNLIPNWGNNENTDI